MNINMFWENLERWHYFKPQRNGGFLRKLWWPHIILIWIPMFNFFHGTEISTTDTAPQNWLEILQCTILLCVARRLALLTLLYSKASRYTALSYTGLADAQFLIGSKYIWDTQIYVLQTLSCTFFDDFALALLNNSSCSNFELHRFFLVPKNMHLKALLHWKGTENKCQDSPKHV